MPVKTQSDYDEAREPYRPAHVKTLLIAEAPPPFESGRFFYFEDVKKHDSLFWETMKVLHGIAEPDRPRKKEYLDHFKQDGYFLIDASETPLVKGSNKKNEIRKSLERLRSKVRKLYNRDTKIVLISKTVYDQCLVALRQDGFNVINAGMIPFPAFNHQTDFREKLSAVIK